jgi:ribosomal protein S27AE
MSNITLPDTLEEFRAMMPSDYQIAQAIFDKFYSGITECPMCGDSPVLTHYTKGSQVRSWQCSHCHKTLTPHRECLGIQYSGVFGLTGIAYYALLVRQGVPMFTAKRMVGIKLTFPKFRRKIERAMAAYPENWEWWLDWMQHEYEKECTIRGGKEDLTMAETVQEDKKPQTDTADGEDQNRDQESEQV